jgi:hypothetical protein
LTWLGDRWDQLWRSLSKRVHFSERTANGIGWTLLAVVSFIILWVAVRLLVNLQLVRSRRRLDAQPLEAPLDPQALFQKAREAASRSEYGRAALLLFAATVALLDLRGAVSGNRSATVGDLRRELRSTDASLVALFDAMGARRTWIFETQRAEVGLAGPTNERVGGDGTMAWAKRFIFGHLRT